jgi:hypothetical protein
VLHFLLDCDLICAGWTLEHFIAVDDISILDFCVTSCTLCVSARQMRCFCTFTVIRELRRGYLARCVTAADGVQTLSPLRTRSSARDSV